MLCKPCFFQESYQDCGPFARVLSKNQHSKREKGHGTNIARTDRFWWATMIGFAQGCVESCPTKDPATPHVKKRVKSAVSIGEHNGTETKFGSHEFSFFITPQSLRLCSSSFLSCELSEHSRSETFIISGVTVDSYALAAFVSSVR